VDEITRLVGQAIREHGLPRSAELNHALRAIVEDLHWQGTTTGEIRKILRALFRDLAAPHEGPEIRLCLGVLEGQLRTLAAGLALQSTAHADLSLRRVIARAD
jgi:hypothetical protein